MSAPEAAAAASPACCPLYHEAIELIGRRWTGAIVEVLLQSGELRFSQIARAVPELSDRLLSERLKDLEGRGVVARHTDGTRALYALTDMGRSLEPALAELKRWAQEWLDEPGCGEALAAGAAPSAALAPGTPSA